MAEVTDIVERVARAMCRADPHVRMGDADRIVEQRVGIEWVHYREPARAALAAMLEAVGEPVAWRYDLDLGPQSQFQFSHGRRSDLQGWTETSLYSLAALREEG